MVKSRQPYGAGLAFKRAKKLNPAAEETVVRRVPM